jgi:hypothetical protein
MADEVKTDEEMKMEDSLYNSSVLASDLFKKVTERDETIALLKENIVLLKRQIILQETVFGQFEQYFTKLRQQMFAAGIDAKSLPGG